MDRPRCRPADFGAEGNRGSSCRRRRGRSTFGWLHVLLVAWLLLAFGILFTGCAEEVRPQHPEQPEPPPPPPPPSGPTFHSATISNDETWSPRGNPHIVTRPLSVDWTWGPDSYSGCARLTILPGCEVRFARGAGLATFNSSELPGSCGAIIAAGTPDSVIVLTADSSAVEPGFWKGLSTDISASAAFGPGGPADSSMHDWFPRQASPGRSDTESRGLVLRWCRIVGAGEAGGGAIRVGWDGSLSMSNSEIQASAGNGVQLYSSMPVDPFEHNTITECRDYPILMAWGATLPMVDCHLTGNAPGKDGIHLENSAGLPQDIVLVDAGVPYVIDDGQKMIVSATDSRHSRQLTLRPGVALRFGRGSGLIVGDTWPGTLVADGAGGLVSLTGAALDPAPGAWLGLRIGPYAGAGTRLVNCRVAGAGGDGRAGVVLEETRPFISGCRIEECASPGFLLIGRNVPVPDLLRARNTFAGNAGEDVAWDPGPGGTWHLENVIGREEVWTPIGNPHRVRNPLRVRGAPYTPGGTKPGKLRILPGCVVWFEPGAGLTVEVDSSEPTSSTLEALGTASDPILFTGAGGVGDAGTWSGVRAVDQAAALLLSHCVIVGAGAGGEAAVVAGRGTLRMNDCEIRNSGGPGAIITASADGLRGNRITGCAGDPLIVSPFSITGTIEGNVVTGNAAGHDRILLVGPRGPLWPNGDLTLTNQGVPYVVSPDCFGHGGWARGGEPAGYRRFTPQLTIGPGCTMLFEGGQLLVQSWSYRALHADGTAGEITLAGAGPAGAPGGWAGIYFDSTSIDSLSQVIRCRVTEAGRQSLGAITIKNARPRIRDCLIEESASWGIYLEGDNYPDPDSLELGNRFAANDSGNVRRPRL